MEQGGAGGGERFGSLPGAGERADGAEFADEHPADQAVVADDDLAVGAAGGVGELDDVVAGPRVGLAERGEVEEVRPGEGQPGQGAGAGSGLRLPTVAGLRARNETGVSKPCLPDPSTRLERGLP